MTDPVNHPDHYAGRIQAVDAIEVWGPHWPREIAVHLAHVVPYVARCGRKGDAVEDLRKARWWIDRAIAMLTDESAEAFDVEQVPAAPQIDASSTDPTRPPAGVFESHDPETGTEATLEMAYGKIVITVGTPGDAWLHNVPDEKAAELRAWLNANGGPAYG